jgi:AraC-like DNA-binding protein
MPARRRIDWPKLVGRDAPLPAWKVVRARSEPTDLLLAFADLFTVRHPDDLLRRAVELALGPVGLIRAGIYLYDERLDLMLGTWGTDLRRRVVDEHQAMFHLGEQGAGVFARAMTGETLWAVVENSPIIVNEVKQTRVVGRGWAVSTPIRSARRALGMMYNDGGLTGTRPDPAKQARAAALCTLVGLLLEGMPPSRGAPFVTDARARHPAIAKAAKLLAGDPSLTAADLAADLQVSPGRFARVFKAEMGLSLVRYRNQLRLERFLASVGSGGANLHDAALAAGFGSYAQFHRVFQALQGTSPRIYFGSRIPGHRARVRARRSSADAREARDSWRSPGRSRSSSPRS